jgi:hypothetical protein
VSGPLELLRPHAPLRTSALSQLVSPLAQPLVEDLTTELNAIILYGDQTSVSALLDTKEGKKSYDELFEALDSANNLLKRNERAADSLILEIEEHNRNYHIGFTTLLSDPDGRIQQFNSVLETATVSIDDSCADIARLFKRF